MRHAICLAALIIVCASDACAQYDAQAWQRNQDIMFSDMKANQNRISAEQANARLQASVDQLQREMAMLRGEQIAKAQDAAVLAAIACMDAGHTPQECPNPSRVWQ